MLHSVAVSPTPARTSKPPTPDCQDAASRWIARHRDPVFWYLRYLRCPHDLAEDLLQEALSRGWQRPDVVALASEHCDRWLRTTARNLFFMHLRRQKTRPEITDVRLLEQVWVEEVQSDQRGEALRACLQTLPPRSRQAVALHYEQGLSRQTIGTKLGITAQSIKSLLRRARQALKRCVERRLQGKR